jgi:hypothetical protein
MVALERTMLQPGPSSMLPSPPLRWGRVDACQGKQLAGRAAPDGTGGTGAVDRHSFFLWLEEVDLDVEFYGCSPGLLSLEGTHAITGQSSTWPRRTRTTVSVLLRAVEWKNLKLVQIE